MFKPASLSLLVTFLFLTQCFAETSFSLIAVPTACIKACTAPAVVPQCPASCSNSCTFIVKDPCCPNVKTGVCDNASSGVTLPGTSIASGTFPVPTGSSVMTTLSSPTAMHTVASSSSMSGVSPSSSSVAASAPTIANSASTAGNMIDAKFGFLAFMITALFLF
ncbi:hypothetical protein BC943DRAFT_323089 [Umbelopsis sp. AD052]|nr:hypothetical protein BC943DRAFT_323089 [Umbelopsis sp. AD052]